MWLRCFWHSIKLALETGGFLIQPVLDEGKPERLSNMQIVEKDMADTLGVPVVQIVYSHEDDLETLMRKLREGFAQIEGLELRTEHPDVLESLKAFHDPSADDCGVAP